MRAFGRKAIFAAELIPMPVDDLLRWRAAGIHLRLIFEIVMLVRQIVDGIELRIECGQVHRALQHVAYIFLVRLECHWLRPSVRSEATTSELQSLMRISSALFYLQTQQPI